MKRVTLKQMAMVNFRGHKSLSIEFTDRTIISGDNRLGKSTVFDAFVWCLFGKDQFDRKDYEIIPIVNGLRADRVDPEVTITLDVDGRNYTLKRVLHQKWVRRRGTAEEVFDGCETLYYINDVPQKASEYKVRVDDMIEETVFKLITNPATFLSMHWTKQREFLFEIAGTVSDAEVAAQSPKFAELLELVNGKSLIDYKKEISARKKKLKADLEDIQPRIDQTSRLMPATADWKAIESEIKSLEQHTRDIELQMSDRSAAIRGQYEDIQAKQKQINDLKTKQMSIVNNAKAVAQQQAFDANQKRADMVFEANKAKQELSNINAEIASINRMIETTRSQIKANENEVATLRAQWMAENEKEYQAKAGCLVCPVFGHECSDQTAADRHVEAQGKAKQSFFDAKEIELKKISEKGASKNSETEGLKTRLSQLESDLKAATDKFDSLFSSDTEANEKLSNLPIIQPAQVIANELPEWQELQKQIQDIEATITEVKPVENADLTAKKSEITVTLDNAKRQLSERDLIVRYNQEIANLESQGKDLAQQIADIEKQEFTIDSFNKVKIDEADRRVNRMFEIVKFQLYDRTIDGNEFEACIPLNKAGVPISATNTAEKINAGLDIIRTLSTFYNVSAPIFCDGAESNNNYLNTGSQMVFLRVTTEKVLTIN